MKKQLAEVVDGTEIKETIEQKILYSCENNGAKDLCSTKNNATCGDGLFAGEERLEKSMVAGILKRRFRCVL